MNTPGCPSSHAYSDVVPDFEAPMIRKSGSFTERSVTHEVAGPAFHPLAQFPPRVNDKYDHLPPLSRTPLP